VSPPGPLVVLMGVSGAGKSTIGPPLAARLGVGFADADDEHTPEARARMAAGLPLDDVLRAPWLDRLHAVLAAHAGDGLVLACSALKRDYRAHLAGDSLPLVFVALVAPPEVLLARLEHRTGHYAGPSLLPSQLAALELGDDVVLVDADGTVDDVVDAAAAAVVRAAKA
jgi:carbohydrate kinase (thermoresistant glucokinase family)